MAQVQSAEGFSKGTLFGILDSLKERAAPIMEQARAALKAEKGEDALKPWNRAYALSGITSPPPPKKRKK
jgi:hypothetical protein